MDIATTTATEPPETFRIIDGRTQEEQNGRVAQGNGMTDEAPNESIFHSFTPLSFDSLAPKISLSIDHVHLQFNNLPDTPLFQPLLSWSNSLCHRLLLTESLHGITIATTDHGVGGSSSNGSPSAGTSAIYCQLDLNLAEGCLAGTGQGQDEEAPSASPPHPNPIELIITPTELSLGETEGSDLSVQDMVDKSKKLVQHLYDSLSTCISLNPLPAVANGSEDGDGIGGSYEIDDSLISAFLDNHNDDSPADQNHQQSDHQIDPSHRFQPY